MTSAYRRRSSEDDVNRLISIHSFWRAREIRDALARQSQLLTAQRMSCYALWQATGVWWWCIFGARGRWRLVPTLSNCDVFSSALSPFFLRYICILCPTSLSWNSLARALTDEISSNSPWIFFHRPKTRDRKMELIQRYDTSSYDRIEWIDLAAAKGVLSLPAGNGTRKERGTDWRDRSFCKRRKKLLEEIERMALCDSVRIKSTTVGIIFTRYLVRPK